MDQEEVKQPFYVANAIPYVNDVPHIGTAYEAVLGDIIARYHQAQGQDVFFSYGADEHGGKIMERAASLNLPPQKFVDKISANLRRVRPNS